MILSYDPLDFSQSKFQSKLKLISSKLSSSPKSLDIRDVITYIITTQKQPYLYQLLRAIDPLLSNISPSTLRLVFNDMESVLNSLQKFETFLLLVRYVVTYDSKISNYRLVDIFNEFAKKSRFFQKEMAVIERERERETAGERNKVDPKFMEKIRLGIEFIPQLYEKINRSIDFSYLSNLIDWILLFQIKSPHDLQTLSRYCRFLTKQPFSSKYNDLPDFTTLKRFLQLVIEKSVKPFEGAQHLFYILESIDNPTIFSVVSEQISFTELPPETYLKCFERLTESALGPRTVAFMTAVSVSLKHEFKFNILKLLYLEFIIPRVVRYYKFCKSQQDEVQRLVSFYVHGFMNRIDIEPSSILYFLENYALMSKSQLQFWLDMAIALAYEKPQLQRALQPLLKEVTPFKDLNLILSPQKYDKKKEEMWLFLDKDLVQRKKYKYYKSQYVGIKNQDANCYMISSLQALFMSRSLPKILKQYQSSYLSRGIIRTQIKMPLLYSLNLLFTRLEDKSKSVTIDDLKEKGPEKFKNNFQQDSQHYLNQLLEQIQKEISLIPDKTIQSQLQEKVRGIFQISTKTQINCSECKSKLRSTDQKSYSLSIDYTQTLSDQWQTTIQDYMCDKCKWRGNHQMRSKIIKFPQILFVHIKRFSFDKKLGEVKRLEEANIIRRFKDYRLEGFICHIGSKVGCGHYTLYYRNPEEGMHWVLFDDREVAEFRVDEEDQCFENNLKSENTPYIAVYKKVKRR